MEGVVGIVLPEKLPLVYLESDPLSLVFLNLADNYSQWGSTRHWRSLYGGDGVRGSTRLSE